MNILKRQHSFTLIELMIVIGIIVILTTIVAVSYAAAAKQSRDGKRQADLVSIRTALEQYRATNASYPSTLGALSTTYMNPVPTDPSTRNPYDYTRLPATCTGTTGNPCTGYRLQTTLEVTNQIFTVNQYGEL